VFIKEMKELVKFAIELDIVNMCTKIGYKGDYIISFSGQQEAISKIKNFCNESSIENKIMHEQAKAYNTIFCVFHAGDDIYKLKD
jgi:hypothetical protein